MPTAVCTHRNAGDTYIVVGIKPASRNALPEDKSVLCRFVNKFAANFRLQIAHLSQRCVERERSMSVFPQRQRSRHIDVGASIATVLIKAALHPALMRRVKCEIYSLAMPKHYQHFTVVDDLINDS